MKRSGQRLDRVKPPCCRSPYGAPGTSSHHAGHVHCASVHEQQQLCKQQRRAAQQAAEAVWSSNSRAGEQADAARRDSRAAAAGQAGVPSIVHQAQTADKQGQCSGGTKAAGRQQQANSRGRASISNTAADTCNRLEKTALVMANTQQQVISPNACCSHKASNPPAKHQTG